VAFATILAVVAGLTLAGASTLSHDIFMHAVRKGRATEREQIRIARAATVVFGSAAIVLGIAVMIACWLPARSAPAWPVRWRG